ncbi:MAG TPA: MBL fold metallo-hydrolase [Smithellaceae bacterium]|nr:MBL fold metallo-hydrolase [Smithellaceae bacterium]HRS89538.1 MBL fold metallo-hydrolase [Smithellaceae bacterium]HRV26488.1 MBL fold metallo-hydrolase [Smithellaceae bacterium]
MKIKWYGHAAFKITTDKGIRMIIDPYEPGAYNGALSYGKIDEEADIVLTSHDHADHNYTKTIAGGYALIDKAGEYDLQGIKIKAFSSFHDATSGKERGVNLIFVIAVDGLNLVHTGDIGHDLDDDMLKKIGKVDIVLLPVGGFFTIDADQAAKMISALAPRVTIPMHYKTDKCGFPIAPAEEFTKGKNNVRVLDKSEVEIRKENLPTKPEVLVLRHAL